MTTYEDSGVNVEEGGRASRLAYEQALRTFDARKGLKGIPLIEHDGFGGLIDMGDHYLVMTSDGTGSKMDLAIKCEAYATLGWDLLAMVADDMICTGAETIAVANTFDVPRVYPMVTQALVQSLADACIAQRIAIPAGEIAEVPGAVNEPVWNATALGIVAKDKVLQPSTIMPGDTVIAIKDACARSNGFSLIRKILKDAHGDGWYHKEWRDGKTWGQTFLTPSTIYSAAILALIGRFGEKRVIDVKGLAHITGGGIPGKLARVLKHSGCGALLSGLWQPHAALRDVINLGKVSGEEAYKTWNMGQGMLVIVSLSEADTAVALLNKQNVEAKVAGEITADPSIIIKTDVQTLSFSAQAKR